MVGRLYGYLTQAWQVAVVLVCVLGAMMLAMSVLLFRRVIRPLGQLTRLMSVIARRDYAPAPTRGVDPILRPIFDRYNEMIARLAAIDEDHHERQDQLERRVRAASHALLQQQVELARSQRLAAAGEVAASLAHEIRNPLASMQMALENLHNDLTDREHVERLDLVLNELRRVARLLADVLDQAHQPPEPVAHLTLRDVVDSLLSLTRYQVPEHLRLIVDIPEDLHCDLPESALRQSLLNLVLNAAQAMAGREGEIRIAADLRDESLALSVCDSGPGFPELLLRTGVRPYDKRRAGGTGLGLATVRRFVRDQHGEMRLENRHPHGACVTLYLPQNGSDDVQVAADH